MRPKIKMGDMHDDEDMIELTDEELNLFFSDNDKVNQTRWQTSEWHFLSPQRNKYQCRMDLGDNITIDSSSVAGYYTTKAPGAKFSSPDGLLDGITETTLYTKGLNNGIRAYLARDNYAVARTAATNGFVINSQNTTQYYESLLCLLSECKDRRDLSRI